MRLASFAVPLLTAATALAGPCAIFYPGTNITNSYDHGNFTMTVWDQVTNVESPLYLVVVGTQPGRTWQILSTDQGPNEGFSKFTMDNYIIRGIPPAPSIPVVRSVGSLNPPPANNATAPSGPGPWFVFSESPTASTTGGFCSAPWGVTTTVTGLLSYSKTLVFNLCQSSFSGYKTNALVLSPVSPLTGPNVLDPASCHRAVLFAHQA